SRGSTAAQRTWTTPSPCAATITDSSTTATGKSDSDPTGAPNLSRHHTSTRPANHAETSTTHVDNPAVAATRHGLRHRPVPRTISRADHRARVDADFRAARANRRRGPRGAAYPNVTAFVPGSAAAASVSDGVLGSSGVPGGDGVPGSVARPEVRR